MEGAKEGKGGKGVVCLFDVKGGSKTDRIKEKLHQDDKERKSM